MRRSWKVLPVMLAGTVLASGGVSGVALGKGAVPLRPLGGWSVSKAGEGTSAGPYCTLARKYENGAVVTFARNMTEEYSVALDFQKAQMDSDKAYKLTLRPGTSQVRAFEILPASENAIVVRLGWDDAFFDALEESQVLKASVDSVEYSFAVPEIRGGQKDLQACVDGMKKASAEDGRQEKGSRDVLGAEAGSMQGGFSARKVSSRDSAVSDKAGKSEGAIVALKDDVSRPVPIVPEKSAGKKAADVPAGIAASDSDDSAAAIRGEIDALRRDNDRLRSALADERKRFEQNFMKDQEKKSAVADQKILEQRLADLQSENTALKAASQSVDDADGKLKALAAERDSLNQKTAALQQENAALKAASQSVDDAEGKLKALAAERDSLNQKTAALQQENAALKAAAETAQKDSGSDAAHMQALQGRLQDLETERATLQEALDKKAEGSTEIVAALRAEKRELEKKLAAVQADNQAMAVRVEELTQRQEDTVLQAAAGNLDMEQAVARFNEAERESRRLGGLLEQERLSCRMEKAELENMLFDPAVADKAQLARLADLEQQLKEAQTQNSGVYKKEAEQVKAQLSAVQAEKTGLEKQISMLQAKISQEGGREQSLESLRNEKDEILAENGRLKADVQSLRARVATDPALEAELAALRKEAAALQEAVAKKDMQISALEAEPKADPKMGAAMVRMQKDMAELLKQKDAIQDRNILLKTEADGLRMQLAEMNTGGAARADQVASLKLEIDDLRRQMAIKDNTVRTFQNQMAAQQQEAAQLKTRLSAAEKDRAQAVAVADEAEDTSALKREMDEMRTRMARMEGAYEEKIAALEEREKAQAQENVAAAMNQYAPAGGGGADYISREQGGARGPVPVSLPLSSSPVVQISKMDIAGLQAFLTQAGLALDGPVRHSAHPAGPGASGYVWTSGGLQGSAAVKPMRSAADFSAFISQYIASAQARCQGDFASLPTMLPVSGGALVSTYEIACVNPARSVSSSILFFERAGDFVALSHEADAAKMDVAMDMRDRLLPYVTPQQTAAR